MSLWPDSGSPLSWTPDSNTNVVSREIGCSITRFATASSHLITCSRPRGEGARVRKGLTLSLGCGMLVST